MLTNYVIENHTTLTLCVFKKAQHERFAFLKARNMKRFAFLKARNINALCF